MRACHKGRLILICLSCGCCCSRRVEAVAEFDRQASGPRREECQHRPLGLRSDSSLPGSRSKMKSRRSSTTCTSATVEEKPLCIKRPSRLTILCLSVCASVCLCICVRVCDLLPSLALSHLFCDMLTCFDDRAPPSCASERHCICPGAAGPRRPN